MGRFLDRQFQWKNDNSYTIFFKDIYIIYVNQEMFIIDVN